MNFLKTQAIVIWHVGYDKPMIQGDQWGSVKTLASVLTTTVYGTGCLIKCMNCGWQGSSPFLERYCCFLNCCLGPEYGAYE